MKKSVCDFCSTGAPVWDFDAESFDALLMGVDQDGNVHARPWHSEGGWFACQECGDYIKAEDWQGLVEHCVDGYIAQGHLPAKHRAELIRSLGELHQAFHAARRGEPTLIDKTYWSGVQE